MKTHSKKDRVRNWLLLLIALLILVELAALVYFDRMLRISRLSAPTARLSGELAPSGTANPPEVLSTQSLGVAIPSPSVAVPPLTNLPTSDPWTGKGRVTILLMGLDYADWESEDRKGPPRSDTMILLTVDPASQNAGLLSIPRDLWVSMPGIDGEHKINTAYRFGEYYQMPGGGPGLAMRTVEKLFGVPVNFYAVVDFYAFEDFINELGGVQIDVPEKIKVDPIGPDNTVVLEPGRQLLDGPTALAYARNRSTRGDETDRARRQQQVIMAIGDQVLSMDKLPLLILKAPSLYSMLGKGVRTNLTLEQAIQLAWLAQKIEPENIQRATIGDREVINDTSPDGQAIFVPIMDRLLALRDKIFTSATPGASQGLTTQELIAAENSRIALVNQTGDTALGDLTAAYLRDKGLNVLQVDQSNESRLKTRLVDQVGDPYTLRYLVSLLQIAPSEIYVQYDQAAATDLVVYLGADWAAENTLQK